MSLTVPGFRALADRAVALAGELCGGRLVAMLEAAIRCCTCRWPTLAILEGLAGLEPSSFATPSGSTCRSSCAASERAAVAAAERVHVA
jgi:hypothetical protein